MVYWHSSGSIPAVGTNLKEIYQRNENQQPEDRERVSNQNVCQICFREWIVSIVSV
jgi:hypothetical protein